MKLHKINRDIQKSYHNHKHYWSSTPSGEPEHFIEELSEALDNNDHPEELTELEIIAEIEGENDGANWHWILKDQNGLFWYFTGWCDYTGWDCQSDLKYFGPFKEIVDALKEVPISDNDNRNPHEMLS